MKRTHHEPPGARVSHPQAVKMHRMRQHPMYARGIGDDALCRSAAANRGATQKCRQKKKSPSPVTARLSEYGEKIFHAHCSMSIGEMQYDTL